MGAGDCRICGAWAGTCNCLRVTVADAQAVLSGDSLVPCSLGKFQSESGGRDPKRAQGAAERRLLRSAAVLRCVEALGKRSRLSFVPCNDLRRFSQKAGLLEGEAAIAVLRAFLPWGSSRQWEPRGVVEVYRFMQTRLPMLRPMRGDTPSEAAMDPQNRERKARAMSLIADAEVVLGAWVEKWNRGLPAIEAA